MLRDWSESEAHEVYDAILHLFAPPEEHTSLLPMTVAMFTDAIRLYHVPLRATEGRNGRRKLESDLDLDDKVGRYIEKEMRWAISRPPVGGVGGVAGPGPGGADPTATTTAATAAALSPMLDTNDAVIRRADQFRELVEKLRRRFGRSFGRKGGFFGCRPDQLIQKLQRRKADFDLIFVHVDVHTWSDEYDRHLSELEFVEMFRLLKIDLGDDRYKKRVSSARQEKSDDNQWQVSHGLRVASRSPDQSSAAAREAIRSYFNRTFCCVPSFYIHPPLSPPHTRCTRSPTRS